MAYVKALFSGIRLVFDVVFLDSSLLQDIYFKNVNPWVKISFRMMKNLLLYHNDPNI